MSFGGFILVRFAGVVVVVVISVVVVSIVVPMVIVVEFAIIGIVSDNKNSLSH